MQGVSVSELEDFIRAKRSWGGEMLRQGVPDIHAALKRLEELQLLRITDDGQVHAVSMLQLLDFVPHNPEEWREHRQRRELERQHQQQLVLEAENKDKQQPVWTERMHLFGSKLLGSGMAAGANMAFAGEVMRFLSALAAKGRLSWRAGFRFPRSRAPWGTCKSGQVASSRPPPPGPTSSSSQGPSS